MLHGCASAGGPEGGPARIQGIGCQRAAPEGQTAPMSGRIGLKSGIAGTQ